MPDTDNPLDPSEAHLQRIRERAYFLWEREGCPVGRDDEYWERARELDAMASNAAGLQPNPMTAHPDQTPGGPIVEEASIQENLGEFPDRLADQGEVMTTPMTREAAKEFRDGSR